MICDKESTLIDYHQTNAQLFEFDQLLLRVKLFDKTVSSSTAFALNLELV